MRVILQKVCHATVEVESNVVGEIDKGILVLAGFEDADTKNDLEWMSNKIANLRIFEDAEGKMNHSVNDIEGNLLIVSQFTLHAQTKKGNRPSYNKAAKANYAEELYDDFVKSCSEKTKKDVKTGVFGADMQVKLVNDGPVTILIDTKNKE